MVVSQNPTLQAAVTSGVRQQGGQRKQLFQARRTPHANQTNRILASWQGLTSNRRPEEAARGMEPSAPPAGHCRQTQHPASTAWDMKGSSFTGIKGKLEWWMDVLHQTLQRTVSMG